ETLPETTYFANQRCLVHPQVAEEILPEEEFPVPVGLEIRGKSTPSLVDLVLIRVDHPPLPVSVKRLDYFKQRMPWQFVVVVQQCDELAPHQIKRGVARLRNVPVHRSIVHANSRITCGVFIKYLPHVPARRCI